MDYTALWKESKTQVLTVNHLPSLYQICQQLTDGRKARGKRYDLAGILVVVVWAKLAGMQSLLAVSEWAKAQEAVIRASVGLGWKRLPCPNTYSYVLARLESQLVNAHVAAWFVRQMTSAPSGESDERHLHLAIDGKALKSTGEQAYGGDHPQQHLLHLYEVETGVVLQQIPIGSKTNEVGALKPWLTEVTCKGRVITVDAAQSYPELPRAIKRAGGEVILLIKDNTPRALSDLELFFEDPQADRRTWRSYSQFGKGHGRLERRSILASPDLNGLFFRDWGEIGQVFRLQRERTSKGKQSGEVRYGLTTLSPHECPPQRLLSYIRAHWNVENHLHRRRDALLGEDRCRVRCIPVMEMLAVLNTIVLSLMRLHHVSLVAKQLRRFAFHPEQALPWLYQDF
ncbi:MAG TPA: ISAs1 family transposase [Ktedonobacteraceae bacterium]|nr:ISAs1 family transposase [Ktedonobacteraceae bacterium]